MGELITINNLRDYWSQKFCVIFPNPEGYVVEACKSAFIKTVSINLRQTLSSAFTIIFPTAIHGSFSVII